jgi:predicted ATPase
MLAHRMMGSSSLLLGEFVEARDHLQRGLALADPARHGGLVAHLGMDLESTLNQMGAWAVCLLGFADQAAAMLRRGIELGSALTQINAKTYTLGRCCIVAMCSRDNATLETVGKTVAELAAQHRIPLFQGNARVYLAWAAMESGRFAEAAIGFERGLDELASVDSRHYLPFFLAGLAMSLVGCDRAEQARRVIEQAFAVCREGEHGWCEAELWRVRGVVLSAAEQGDRSEAARSFEHAITLARTQQARLWELRAATSFARLLSRAGESARAEAVLRPVHEWFTEGLATPDLADARALLAAPSAT